MTPKAKLTVDQFAVDDLVLPVSTTYDPAKLDLAAYEDFIDAVVAGRGYSKQAILTALRFMAGGRYATTEQLAEEAFAASPALERRYGTVGRLLAVLPFPDKLACSLDLATATGKSYVMFCLARIMLNEGLVNRVLVLCPSLTIESGLNDKFDALLADSDLTALLPDSKGTRLPERVDANQTVKEGQICIENIHAVYETTGSSIADSFEGHGSSTLVLSDECHHIYSPGDKNLRSGGRSSPAPNTGSATTSACPAPATSATTTSPTSSTATASATPLRTAGSRTSSTSPRTSPRLTTSASRSSATSTKPTARPTSR